MSAIKVGIVGTGSVASSVHLPILTRRTDLFEIDVEGHHIVFPSP